MAHAGGRPKKYNSPDDMQIKIDAYIASCGPHPLTDKDGNPVCDKKGIPVVIDKPLTMSGLANALGLDRKSLLNYSKQDEFFPAIARARRLVEQYAEEQLFNRDAANGAKFALANNHGWTERQEITADVAITADDKALLERINKRMSQDDSKPNA